MSELTRFLGIVIAIYYREHGVPHLHVTYAGDAAIVRIKDGKVLAGKIQAPALRLAQEWIAKHSEWLLASWKTANAGENVGKSKKTAVKGRKLK